MIFEAFLFCWVVLLPASIQQLDGGNENEVAKRAEPKNHPCHMGPMVVGSTYSAHRVQVANERFMLGLLQKMQ